MALNVLGAIGLRKQSVPIKIGIVSERISQLLKQIQDCEKARDIYIEGNYLTERLEEEAEIKRLKILLAETREVLCDLESRNQIH